MKKADVFLQKFSSEKKLFSTFRFFLHFTPLQGCSAVVSRASKDEVRLLKASTCSLKRCFQTVHRAATILAHGDVQTLGEKKLFGEENTALSILICPLGLE